MIEFASMMKQVYIADLKSAGASHPGSIPGTRTKQSGVSTMDSTMSFYLMNVGSIPARRTKFSSSLIRVRTARRGVVM